MIRHPVVLSLVLLGVASAAAAQRTDPGPAYATRATLEQSLREAEGHDAPRDGKGKGKGNANWNDDAQLIRARLDSGDFRPGDRILLLVEGETALSDTFTVGMGSELTLPQIGAVPLAGVLRAELPGHLNKVLKRYLRSPVIHVRSMIRVSVEGEVNKPGFYAVAPETPVMDAFEAAGGLTREARLEKVRVERDGIVVLSGRPLERAVRAGHSLDALNLRAGDRVYVPRRPDIARTAQLLGLLLTIPIAIYTLSQIKF